MMGVIAPWNYPLSLAITDALPALLAGNAVSSSRIARTRSRRSWRSRCSTKLGCRVISSDRHWRGAENGPVIIAGVNYVTFTGSTATGRTIARQAAGRLIGCSLELGGKNAMLVLPDANLAMAVEGAILGSFASAGQLCVSIERLSSANTSDRYVLLCSMQSTCPTSGHPYVV